MYGYNKTTILYPFERSKQQQETWLKRTRNIYDFPDSFVPVWSRNETCSHGYQYDDNDANMVEESTNILLFNNIGEQVFTVKNYARKSLHSCKERMRYDGHPEFVWNLGGGRYVNYTLLFQYLHLWKNDGLSIHAMHKSILEMSSACGITSSLTYNDLHRAVTGFFVCLGFDEKIAFECPSHGSSPPWINTDGKCTGPAKRRVKHIQELDHHKDDLQVWAQSTTFQDRVFLPNTLERSLVCDLVTGKITCDEFLASEITTENGHMVADLVTYLADEWPEELPKQYLRFLSNISKGTSVRGLLQVSSGRPLEYLKKYCEENVDIRDASHIDKLRLVMSELPAFWAILDSICLLENRSFLPGHIGRIVLKILEIRKKMFDNAVHREETDYVKWEGREHETMCYPNLKLFRFPKKVQVNKKVDKDMCEKNFPSDTEFTAGIFTIGCACEYNTTLGKYILSYLKWLD